MSRSGLNLALTLFARDNASKVINKTLQDVVKGSTAAQKATDKLASEQKKSADTGIKASRTLADEMRRSASARSTLGIRSEQQIRREIQQTEAAYNRLARSGTMSANEQSRAYAGMQQRVGSLKTELVGVNQQMSMFQRAKGMALTGGAIVGGITAASAVIAQPVRNAMSYGKRLAKMSNTAYSGQSVEAHLDGMKVMDGIIQDSVTKGGGTKESAAMALDAMLSKGIADVDSAKTLLPIIQKYATGTESDPSALIEIFKSLKAFGVKDEDMEAAMNMSIVAGEEGSFELADMASWLPKQLTNAGVAGMGGLDDYASILSLNQAAAITAGSSDEAGNNASNLLAKISSPDTRRALARTQVNGKGVDLPGSLVAAKGKGTNQLDGFMNVMDAVVESNPEYKKLEQQYLNAKGTEKEQIFESMKKTLEGSAVGTIIPDQQALMAAMALRANREYANNVKNKANAQRNLKPGEMSAGDIAFEVMKSTPDFKVNQLNNVKDFAQIDAMNPLANALGDLSQRLTDYSSAYPGLTTVVVGATDAIKAMAAAAAVFGGIKMLGGGALGGSGGGFRLPGSKGGSSIPGLPGFAQGVAGAIPVEVVNWPDGGLMGKDDDGSVDKPDLSTGIVDTALALATEQWNIKEEAAQQGISPAELVRKRGEQREEQINGWLENKGFNPNQWLSDNVFSPIQQAWNGDESPASAIQTNPFDEMAKKVLAATSLNINPTGTLQPPPQPIQVTTQLEIDGRKVAEIVNEYNNTQGQRGTPGGPV